MPTIVKLQKLRIYQISAIRKTLDLITDTDPEILEWRDKFLDIVNSGNEELFLKNVNI